MAKSAAKLMVDHPVDHVLIDGNRMPKWYACIHKSLNATQSFDYSVRNITSSSTICMAMRLFARLPCPATTVVKGDSKSVAIAAASIVAKVTRDRLMEKYDKEFPGYGLAQHKGSVRVLCRPTNLSSPN